MNSYRFPLVVFAAAFLISLLGCAGEYPTTATGQAAFHANQAQVALSSGDCTWLAGQVEMAAIRPGGFDILLERFAKSTSFSNCYARGLRISIANADSQGEIEEARNSVRVAKSTGLLPQDEGRQLDQALLNWKSISAQISDAKKGATFACLDKAHCDKAFALTQIYLNEISDMKLQIATDSIIETYNPNNDTSLALKAIRLPGKGDSAAILFSATCRDMKNVSCKSNMLKAYTGYSTFIDGALKN